MFFRQEILPGVSVAFTDARTGNLALHTQDQPEAVRRRRAALEQQIGAGPFAYLSQVHSGRVVDATHALNAVTEADAMVSVGGAEPLAIMAADCLPVVFLGTRADAPVRSVQRSGAVPVTTAVAHAGRRGLLDGILANTVRELRACGIENVSAWIGPSICGNCYEVPELMAAEAEGILPGIRSRTSAGTSGLDLPGAAETQLRALGVSVNRDANACTLEHPELYSYRENNTIRRHAGLIWRHP